MASENKSNDTLHIRFPKDSNTTTSEFMRKIKPLTENLENDYDIIGITKFYANIKFSSDQDAENFMNSFKESNEDYEVSFYKEKIANRKIHISHLPIDLTINRFLELISSFTNVENLDYQFNSEKKYVDVTFDSSEEANNFKEDMTRHISEYQDFDGVRVNFYKNKNNQKYRSERYDPYRGRGGRGGRARSSNNSRRYEERGERRERRYDERNENQERYSRECPTRK